jgi:GT2 family glycosyltransferase
MMKVGIASPIYHSNDLHADFTKQTVESIVSEENELKLYLIVNYSIAPYYPTKDSYSLHDSVKSLDILENPLGNHVGGGWNYGIKKALEDGCDYCIVPNNDIIFHPKAIDNLVRFANNHPEFIMWSASEWLDPRTIKNIPEDMMMDVFDDHPHFSCFMVNQKTIDTVGWFDEKLKMAYFEDFDYHYRTLLSGNKAGKTNTSKFYHYGSRTIKVDDELNAKNRRTYEENRSYVKAKWGLDPHDKVYSPPEAMLKDGYQYPFNNSKKDLKSW